MNQEEHLKEIHAVQKRDFENRVDDLNALKRVFGEQVVDVVLTERGEKVRRQWREIAQEHGKTGIDGLKETLWTWVREKGFEFTSREAEGGTQFEVTKCPLADFARELNAADWGYTCFCADDEHIVAGFDSTMGFRRTKTLMEGDACCDHFYFKKTV